MVPGGTATRLQKALTQARDSFFYCTLLVSIHPNDGERGGPRRAAAHTPAARFQNNCSSGDSLPVQPSTRPRAKVRCSSSLENMRLMPSKL